MFSESCGVTDDMVLILLVRIVHGQVLSLAEVGGSLVVLEDADPGAFIALVRVTDSDAEANGQVSCMLLGAPGEPPPPFSLRSSAEPGEWAFVTSGSLDRDYKRNTSTDYKGK